MERVVTALPVIKRQERVKQRKNRKVAAYARVSTDAEEQLTSYNAQVKYYSEHIKHRDDWEFAGIYTDEGISGTSTKHRDGFNQMVRDALDGKIDLIITKSVSRFARNTVDTLVTVRKLKEHGVEVYFEKENIYTMDSKGELLITIMSSLAQEESRSISENVKWGHRKRFRDGKASVGFGRFLGYDRGEDGSFKVNHKEAEIVRLIYKMFLLGMGYKSIATELMERGIKSPGGKDKWHINTIRSILTNEKYKGDALLQKSYTADFLTKKIVKNKGEVEQFYVENSHEAIIDREMFDMVQAEIERRSGAKSRYSSSNIIAGRLKCSDCGSWFGAKVWHSNDQYRRVIFRCNHKFEGGRICSTPHVTEEQVKEKLIEFVNRLLFNRKEVVEGLRQIKMALFCTEGLQDKLKDAEEYMAELAEAAARYIKVNASERIDQSIYKARYEALSKEYQQAKTEKEGYEKQLENNSQKAAVLDDVIASLDKLDEIEEFDEKLWAALIEFATVGKDGNITFTLRGGMKA